MWPPGSRGALGVLSSLSPSDAKQDSLQKACLEDTEHSLVEGQHPRPSGCFFMVWEWDPWVTVRLKFYCEFSDFSFDLLIGFQLLQLLAGADLVSSLMGSNNAGG